MMGSRACQGEYLDNQMKCHTAVLHFRKLNEETQLYRGEHRGSLRRRSKKISESEKPKPAVASPQKPDVKVGQKLIEKEKAETGKVITSEFELVI